MRIGVVFPQTEMGGDVGAVRAWADAVGALGFAHVLTYDHVVGADPSAHPGWAGPYDVSTTFHEPFVLFGYLAARLDIELVTGIIIAPQRQTVLLAKQAAEVDLLTDGRFRLGVGIGWNAVEYEALGQDFHTRGRRMSAQIGLLRRLWTEPVVTHEDEFDVITGAGLAPLPVQRPIPIWIGGASDGAYRRVGRLADGWFPQVRPGDDLERALEVIGEAASAAGRDPASIGMEGRVSWDGAEPDRFVRQVERWRSTGASHLSVNTMAGRPDAGPGPNVADLERVAAALGLTG